MPEISPRQADALRVLHWLLSEEHEHRASGRTMALAIAYLRLASQHPAGTWIKVRDHTSTPPSTSSTGDRALLRYIFDLAAGIPAPIEVNEPRSEFRLMRSDAEVRRYLYNDFVVGEERGLTPEQIEEQVARRPSFLDDDAKEHIEWAIHNPTGAAPPMTTIAQATQAMADQRQIMFWPRITPQAQGQDPGQLGAIAAAMSQVAQGMQGMQQPVQQANQALQQLGQTFTAAMGQPGLSHEWPLVERETPEVVVHEYNTTPLRPVSREQATIREAALAHIQTHPGLSATQIAHAIGASPGTVSSILLMEHRLGRVRRESEGGPRGGRTYFPLTPPEPRALGPSVWQRLKTNPFA